MSIPEQDFTKVSYIKSDKVGDPIYFNLEDMKYYFWDETWSYSYGPYETYTDCVDAVAHYCETELG